MKETLNRLIQHSLVRRLVLAIRFFTTKRVLDSASALTYSTVLSIVPISAVVFAIARGFGYTKYIEQWFRHLLSSQPQAADFIIAFVNSYLEHTKSGIILGIGLLFMLYTVVTLTRNVEQTFNDIWHVESRRSIMTSFTDYIAIFVLVPIVIIVMSGLSMFFAAAINRMGWEQMFGPIKQWMVDFIPFLLMWGAFTLLYRLMPNTKVRFGCTWGPGFLAAVAMWVLQWFYVNAQMWVSNYNAIYGSFAALPLFLLWIQFSWTICLFGAELSYTNQNLEDFAYSDGAQHMSHRYRLLLSLILMSKICKRFNTGQTPYNAEELKSETDIPLSVIRDLLIILVRTKLLVEIYDEDGKSEAHYQPSLTINKITVGSVMDRLEAQGQLEMSINLKSQFKDNHNWHDVMELRKKYIADLDQFALKDM